ncbi:hypothetical protein K7X08_027324 [Anisodus acutangulus]|uniref:SKP1 component dimerisation domain-containing protein n=1 Tax=Anisodus acutangulus TaxID=402998 RepID=A0A9Q1RKW1_9SOLA|nr:hypothetical protein K7X08_027324 [Anisodus acutangulus]
MSSSKMIVLKSSDGDTFEVEESVSLESHTIKHMIEDDCANTSIPLPNVTSMILAKSLLDLTCQTVADMIKWKTPEEIRKTFNIKNDFTPEEEEEVRRKNAWAFELSFIFFIKRSKNLVEDLRQRNGNKDKGHCPSSEGQEEPQHIQNKVSCPHKCY